MVRTLPIAVLVSGQGTTLDALAEAVAGGHVPARIVLVVSDRPYAPAVEKARRRGLPTAVIPSRGVEVDAWAQSLSQVLVEAGAQLVVLAGFLAILPPSFSRTWAGQAINLHPALLPRHGGRGMYGMRVHEAVLRAGEAETGATVHLVTDDVDHGPILLQERVPVSPGDTPEVLRERVRPAELKVLFEVIRKFADGAWPLPYRSSAETPARGHDGASG
jgi:formyltetrahydrofolate-dependent phosphoribosylglycinamide formyltransferase